MKKLLLIFAFFIIASNFSIGQIKIKAGTSISTITGHLESKTSNNYSYLKHEDLTQSKIGFFAGIGYEIYLSNKFNFTPEILFNQMGAKGKEYINDRKTSYYQNHLSFPLFFEYKIIENFKIGLGPQIDYLIKSKYEIDTRNLSSSEPQNPGINHNSGMEDTDIYHRLNYGLTTGISYTFSEKYIIEARYYYGLTNLYNEDKLPKFNNVQTSSEMKNQSIHIGIAYKFE